MIHLDTFGISNIAKDENLKDAFYRYLENADETLLLNPFQLIELMKSSRDGFKKQLHDFIKEVPRKRLLTLVIIDVIYQEIANTYYNGRILTQGEFEKNYTEEFPPSMSVEALLKGAEKTWAETREMQQAWVGGVLFGKYISTKKKAPGTGRLKVNDFLTRLKPNVPCKPFKRGEVISAFDKHAPVAGDLIAFSEYMYVVNRVERSQGQEIIDWIQGSIEQFHFPKQVLNWRASKFLEQDFFMRIAGHALENMPEVKDTPEKFYKKINLMNQWEFPSFFMVHKVADFLKQRPQKQKASDYFDILYLALLPYVSMFLCDREIYSAITDVSKTYRLKRKFKHYIWPEFLKCLQAY